METICYKALGTNIRLNFLNFQERPVIFKPADPSETEKADLDIFLYRCEKAEISARIQKSSLKVDIKMIHKKKVAQLYDAKRKRVFCFFQKGLPVDFLVDRLLNFAIMDLQNILDIIFIHSASVVINGKAHLFIAPSGGGKSTICSLAGKRGLCVIHDDFCVVKRSDERFFAARFPCFLPLWSRPEEWEIGGVFLLNKSDKNRVSSVSGIEALRRALPESAGFFRENVGAVDREEYLRNVFDIMNDIVERVGLRILDFKKHESVFSCLT